MKRFLTVDVVFPVLIFILYFYANESVASATAVQSSSSTSSSKSIARNFEKCHDQGIRKTLTFCQLTKSLQTDKPIDMEVFTAQDQQSKASNTFQGKLTLLGESTGGSFKFRGGIKAYDSPQKHHLPEFEFEFVQSGDSIIPVERGVIRSYDGKDAWEYILEPGKVWDEATDNGYSRAAIPFALQLTNQNCVHNGVLSFLFKDDGSISNVYYQISSETCLTYKADFWGSLNATYRPLKIASASLIKSQYEREVSNRMLTKPISELLNDYPDANINLRQFGRGISKKHMTLYGLVIRNIHYVSSCETRNGNYPFCDVLVLPSYSTAKSMFAGIALMRLEKQYPGVKNALISDYVDQCNNKEMWDNVTFEHTLDMATGNYSSKNIQVDESKTGLFFTAFTHKNKIFYACNKWPHKVEPGTQWNYHTTDTYLLTTAMNNFLKEKKGMEHDIYSQTIAAELWSALNLSPTAMISKRSYDSNAQAWGGYGLNLHRDDVAKVANFLNLDQGKINGQQMVEPEMLKQAMQRSEASPSGLPINTNSSTTYYKNGFWAFKANKYIDCKNKVWIPFMSGYGGINISLLPNGMTFYYFSDNNDFFGTWVHALGEANKISSLCTS